jgi:nucleoside-diphosphate-sugar epimerase
MITVLGASGFVGSNLVNILRQKNMVFNIVTRGEELSKQNLGHVIYCIGMTADFRTKPFETVEAHVSKLALILQTCIFESFTYLSSTRVYLKSKTVSGYLTEKDDIVINSGDAFDLFAASKITGELVALNCGRENIKIVRLSNVFGADFLSQNFITSIVKDAIEHKKVELFTTADSSKDYISVEDVCYALIKLIECPDTGVYNLTYGKNTTNEIILNELQKLTGAQISYSTKAQRVIFQEISNAKINEAIGFTPKKNLITSLPEIISAYKN